MDRGKGVKKSHPCCGHHMCMVSNRTHSAPLLYGGWLGRLGYWHGRAWRVDRIPGHYYVVWSLTGHIIQRHSNSDQIESRAQNSGQEFCLRAKSVHVSSSTDQVSHSNHKEAENRQNRNKNRSTRQMMLSKRVPGTNFGERSRLHYHCNCLSVRGCWSASELLQLIHKTLSHPSFSESRKVKKFSQPS